LSALRKNKTSEQAAVGVDFQRLKAMPPVSEGDSALVRVLEASIETLKAGNEILRRRLAAAEGRAADGRLPSFRRSSGSGRGRPPLAIADPRDHYVR
jgi:hypothetical protein